MLLLYSPFVPCFRKCETLFTACLFNEIFRTALQHLTSFRLTQASVRLRWDCLYPPVRPYVLVSHAPCVGHTSRQSYYYIWTVAIQLTHFVSNCCTIDNTCWYFIKYISLKKIVITEIAIKMVTEGQSQMQHSIGHKMKILFHLSLNLKYQIRQVPDKGTRYE